MSATDGVPGRAAVMLLDRLLEGLDVEVGPVAVHDGRCAPTLDRGSLKAPTVHYTRSGAGSLELACGATVCLSSQAVIVLPAQRRARTISALGAPRLLEPCTGDSDLVTAYVRIRATYHGSVNLFDHLSEPLVEPLVPDDPIRRSLEELLAEIAAFRPGCRAMAETLLRRSLILLLRRCFEHGDYQLTRLAALQDTRLGRAVAAMHAQPEHTFTLPELAEVAGMSRTVFAARFTDALAQPPIEFLKQLRLTRAAHLLARTELPVKTVAARVGYASRSSFTRAFVAWQGAAPTAFRARAGEPTPSRVDRVLTVVRASRTSSSPGSRPAA